MAVFQINTYYPVDSYFVYVLKMEYVSKIKFVT